MFRLTGPVSGKEQDQSADTFVVLKNRSLTNFQPGFNEIVMMDRADFSALFFSCPSRELCRRDSFFPCHARSRGADGCEDVCSAFSSRARSRAVRMCVPLFPAAREAGGADGCEDVCSAFSSRARKQGLRKGNLRVKREGGGPPFICFRPLSVRFQHVFGSPFKSP